MERARERDDLPPANDGSVNDRLDLLEAETAVLLETARVLAEAVARLAEGLEMVPTEDPREHTRKVALAAREAHELLLAPRPSR